jgi:hypothetical protein
MSRFVVFFRSCTTFNGIADKVGSGSGSVCDCDCDCDCVCVCVCDCDCGGGCVVTADVDTDADVAADTGEMVADGSRARESLRVEDTEGSVCCDIALTTSAGKRLGDKSITGVGDSVLWRRTPCDWGNVSERGR